jgi:hypothetical protein
MLFYRYVGMTDGAPSWAVEQKAIGTGWNNVSQVFGGDNGAIYAIRPNGQMLFYRYAGMADGAPSWAVEQKAIGTGWAFRQVIAGNVGNVAAGPPTHPTPPPAVTGEQLSEWSSWSAIINQGSNIGEFRYRFGWNPKAANFPGTMDAILEIKNRLATSWSGSARGVDCKVNKLGIGSKDFTLRPHETQTIQYATANCGTPSKPSFNQPSVVKIGKFD